MCWKISYIKDKIKQISHGSGDGRSGDWLSARGRMWIKWTSPLTVSNKDISSHTDCQIRRLARANFIRSLKYVLCLMFLIILQYDSLWNKYTDIQYISWLLMLLVDGWSMVEKKCVLVISFGASQCSTLSSIEHMSTLLTLRLGR